MGSDQMWLAVQKFADSYVRGRVPPPAHFISQIGEGWKPETLTPIPLSLTKNGSDHFYDLQVGEGV